MALYDASIKKVESAVKQTARNQEIIAKNIANLSNPDYVPKTFASELDKAKYQRERKVNLEKEMAKMGQNAVKYNTCNRLWTIKYQYLRKVATQGK